jgi:hypothetical protein
MLSDLTVLDLIYATLGSVLATYFVVAVISRMRENAPKRRRR